MCRESKWNAKNVEEGMTNIWRVVELAVVWRSYILVMDVVCEWTSKAWLTSMHHGWWFWRWICCKEILMWREINRSFKMFVGVLSIGVVMWGRSDSHLEGGDSGLSCYGICWCGEKQSEETKSGGLFIMGVVGEEQEVTNIWRVVELAALDVVGYALM